MVEKLKHIFNLPNGRVHRLLMMFLDLIFVNLAGFLALYLRFDFQFADIPYEFILHVADYLPILCVTTVIVFYICRLYHSVWRLVSITELEHVAVAVLINCVLQYVGMYLLHLNMPRSYYFGSLVFQLMFVGSLRFGYRLCRHLYHRYLRGGDKEVSRVMIVGAGDAGQMVLNDLYNHDVLSTRICCFIDDNPAKRGSYINGVPVVGGRNEIIPMVRRHHIDKIIVAMPSATGLQRREILEICKHAGCELHILPGLYQIVEKTVTVDSLRKVNVEDLLGREPVAVDCSALDADIRDKVVLVTGGGGSIGSELCRQIAQRQPKRLIVFDIYENNAYDLQQALKREYPDLQLSVIIGSVRDQARLDAVFAQYRPELVYHAAAHKHVPLMEDSPGEAVKNNVLGTYNTAKTADRYGVRRFVLISTDKAVNPTNIMGASKRLCEMIVQTLNRRSQTEFVSVRFGNVLGSSGSVIPLFERQIAEGGPVTVTHRDIIRYFMTIPEAVSLILQAGAYAKGGEIFVLDMGQPVKIDDLARNMILLSGLIPGVDIDIVYTGLRPGEKLYEEMLMAEEGMTQTANKQIFIGHPIELDEETLLCRLDELAADSLNDEGFVRRLVEELVPTFHQESHAVGETGDVS